MGSQKAKKRKRKKKALDAFKSSLSEKGLLSSRQIVYTPPGQTRMSDVLEEFIEPYADFTGSEDELRKLLSIALVAWNAALLPVEKRKRMVDEIIVKALPIEVRKDAEQIIGGMIRRKEEHFGRYRRKIVDYQVTKTKEGIHLSVASTP